MRLHLLAGAACCALFLPLAASAAAYTSASDVFATLEQSTSPLSFNVEGHVNSHDTTFVSAWLTGTLGSQSTDQKATVKGTFDLSTTNGVTGRLKADGLVVDHTMFARLTSLKGAYENAAVKASLDFLQKKWLKSPISQDMTQTPMHFLFGADADQINNLFSFESAKTAHGTMYTIKLKPEMQQEFLNLVAPNNAADTTVNVSMKAELDANNALVSLKLYVDATQNGVHIVIIANLKKAAEPAVQAPNDAMTEEEFMSAFGNLANNVPLLPSFVSPAAQLSDARNAQRKSDVTTDLNAVYQYAIDNNGKLPFTLPVDTAVEICASNPLKNTCLDLSVLEGNYLVAIPSDPQAPSNRTYYTIMRDANNRITVTATHAEGGQTISVTR